MKKKKQTKPTDRELIHQWANDLITEPTEAKGGRFDANSTELFRNTKRIGLKHKGFAFIGDFYTNGRYSIGTHSIVSSFANGKYKVIQCHEVPHLDALDADWLRKFFFHRYDDQLDKVAYLRSIVKDKKVSAVATWHLPDFNDPIKYATKIILAPFHTILQLKKLFGKEFTLFAKTELTYNCLFKVSTGWGYSNYKGYHEKLNFKFKDLLAKGKELFLSKEVLDEVHFRIWRYDKLKLGRRMYFAYDTCKNAYGTEKQAELERTVNAVRQSRAESAYKKRVQEEAEKLAKDFQKIADWRKHPSYHSRPTTAYPILAIHYPTQGKSVITTLGVSIPMDEAMKAFTIFKKCVVNKKALDFNTSKQTISGYRLISIQIEEYVGYVVDDFKIALQTKVNWVLTVGCHKIPYEEVQAFLEYNKLDWNDTLAIEP